MPADEHALCGAPDPAGDGDVWCGTGRRISYVTLIHGFLNLSLLTMSATVVVNLLVAAQDKRGREERGDRIDRFCR